jgi:peptide/nickel transport system substrate-binding protein
MQRFTAGRRWADQRLSRRRLLYSAGATGIATAGLLAACAGNTHRSGNTRQTAGANAGPIKRGGTLTVFGGTAPPSEEMETQGARSNSAAAQPLFALIYSGLIRLKVGGQYTFTDTTLDGSLASQWEAPDNQTFVFHLRPGVKFHNKPPVNGRALTSADVKFTFDRFIGSPFAYANFYTSIASVETPDAQTVVFNMKAPDAAFLLHLAVGFAWIIAKEAGKPNPKGVGGLDYHDPATAIGTGPFMLDQYTDQKQSFVRNPDYWEAGLPYLDRVEYVVVPDTATQVAVIQAGQVMIGSLPLGSEQDFKARNPKITYSQDDGLQAWYTAMRVDQPPFTDVRVRRALAMAWNQDEVKTIWGIPTNSPSSYGSLIAVTGDAFLPLEQLGDNAQWWKVNQQAAKQLLAAAGYPDGFEVDYNDSTCCQTTMVPEQFVADMAKIGVKVNIKTKEHAQFQATTSRGEYTGTGISQVPVYDADDFFSSVVLAGAVRNISHANDPTVNDLTAKERAELDPAKRLDIIHQLVRYLAGQIFQLVLPQTFTTTTIQPYVKNYSSRLGYQPSFEVTWLDR